MEELKLTKMLTGHVSQDTAYVVDSYPYGFNLRCKIRFWIETKTGKGQRFVSQTTNPKKVGEYWNKPKCSTYSPIKIMGLDEKGHVQNTGIGGYESNEEIKKFQDKYAEALQDRYSLTAVDEMIRLNNAYAKVKVEFKVHLEDVTNQVPNAIGMG